MKNRKKNLTICSALLIIILSVNCVSSLVFAGEREDEYYRVNSTISSNNWESQGFE